MAAPGFGKEGFCKICAHPDAHVFIRGAREGGKTGKGWNAKEAQEAGKVYDLTFDRATWYKHLEHARTGEQRMIQAAEKVRQSTALTAADVRRGSTELLDAIIDIGATRALTNPDQVTIDHALKAAKIKESRKDRGSDQMNILVQFVTGNPPPVTIIEGTDRTVSQEVPAE